MFKCIIVAIIESKAKLGKPIERIERNNITGKPQRKKINTFDQESHVEIEFPEWPLKIKYINEAIERLRSQSAVVAMQHLSNARKAIDLSIHVQPIILSKQDKYKMETEKSMKHGYAFQYPVEWKPYPLESYYVKIKIPYLANNLESEFTVHQGMDKILPSIKQVLINSGVSSL